MAPVAAIAEIVELNIGHAIVARALFDGLAAAVREMKALMLRGARRMIFGIGIDVLEARACATPTRASASTSSSGC